MIQMAKARGSVLELPQAAAAQLKAKTQMVVRAWGSHLCLQGKALFLYAALCGHWA